MACENAASSVCGTAVSCAGDAEAAALSVCFGSVKKHTATTTQAASAAASSQNGGFL